MLTQGEIERERYEARLKFQQDFDSEMAAARTEGLIQGEKIGAIHVCEWVLNRPETPSEQLAAMSLEDLTRMADDLEKAAVEARVIPDIVA